jgi:bacillithiol system protein YtxJ
MINWLVLDREQQLDEIAARSNDVPCVIFKHSTRCSVSSAAKYRLEEQWDFPVESVQPYFLDLLSYRSVSDQVAERFDVFHESPQMLLIKNGECICEASHLDISVDEIRECLPELV